MRGHFIRIYPDGRPYDDGQLSIALPLTVPLPPASPRRLSHTRTVVYRGYDREDGLWDIEAELTDVKPYTFEVPNERPFPAEEPIHGLSIRITLDDQFVIHDIVSSMDDIPHPECAGAPVHMHRLKGQRMGAGWRKLIQQHIGGTEGCTHLREMLFNMATAAIQMLYNGLPRKRERLGLPVPPMTRMPPHLDQCMTWALDGPATERNYPIFFRPREQAIPPEATPPAA